MSSHATFAIQVDATKNQATIRFAQHVTPAAMQACQAEVEKLLPELRPGFTLLTDLSDLASMDVDCVSHLTRIMDLIRTGGVSTVVRVVPDPDKDIGFKILSIIHYRRGVQIVTCATLAEAERVLSPA